MLSSLLQVSFRTLSDPHRFVLKGSRNNDCVFKITASLLQQIGAKRVKSSILATSYRVFNEAKSSSLKSERRGESWAPLRPVRATSKEIWMGLDRGWEIHWEPRREGKREKTSRATRSFLCLFVFHIFFFILLQNFTQTDANGSTLEWKHENNQKNKKYFSSQKA